MTLSNKLTISRILVTPVFVFFLLIKFPLLALTIFLLAMLTDYLDGVLARSRGEITKLGSFMDPLADKILVTSAFICFVSLPEIALPAWMAIVIVSREFAITGLRLVASGQGVVIAAGRWGKHKTVSQVIAVVGALLYLNFYYDPRIINQTDDYRGLLMILMWLTVVLTTFSGIYYLAHNYRYFREETEDESLKGKESNDE